MTRTKQTQKLSDIIGRDALNDIYSSMEARGSSGESNIEGSAVDDGFEDDEDRKAFQEFDDPDDDEGSGPCRYFSSEVYKDRILPLKHNKKESFRFDGSLLTDSPMFSGFGEIWWSENTLKRLGSFVARATNLKEVTIDLSYENGCGMGHDDISNLFHFTPKKHSLKKFRLIQGYDAPDLLSESIRRIGRYLKNAKGLRQVTLVQFRFDKPSTRILSTALSGNQLRKLELDNCCMDGGTLATIVTMLDDSKLEELSLLGCGIGLETLGAIANILENPNSVLKTLHLSERECSFDYHDYNGVDLICRSLKHNKKLRSLWLCMAINVSTLKRFQHLVFCRLWGFREFVNESNHTLQELPMLDAYYYCDNEEVQVLKSSLQNLLSINRARYESDEDDYSPRNLKLRRNQKIIMYLSMDGKFDTTLFEIFPSALKLLVLELLGAKEHYPECCKWNDHKVTPLDGTYHFIKQFPMLCGHPSPEKVRFTARIDELLAENKELREKNAAVSLGCGLKSGLKEKKRARLA